MSETMETERSDVREDGRRPPRAVVGSHRIEEEIFGKAFDSNIVKQFFRLFCFWIKPGCFSKCEQYLKCNRYTSHL